MNVSITLTQLERDQANKLAECRATITAQTETIHGLRATSAEIITGLRREVEDTKEAAHFHADQNNWYRGELTRKEEVLKKFRRERDEEKGQMAAAEVSILNWLALGAEVVGENEDLRASHTKLTEALESMARQFAYPLDNPPRLGTGGLSALEETFTVLGWSDPQPVPEYCCQIPGCGNMATCGSMFPDGYKRTCGPHFRQRDK